MTAAAVGAPEIHLFEPSGYGGVFQHTCQLAAAMAEQGSTVVLHTSEDHETVTIDGFRLCRCTWWPRPPGGSRPRRAARKIDIARRLATRTIPHVARTVPRGSVLHLQGVAATGAVNIVALAAGRRAGLRVVYSPHDVFSRRGRVDELLLRATYRLPHAVVVHSLIDEQRLTRITRGSVRAAISPLIQVVPMPSEDERRRWRRAWGADDADTVVLFAGFIRPEKRLDVLVESARGWPPGRRLAVVGTDRGGWARCADLARTHGVDVSARLEFVDLREFTAAIAAAELVVVPSEQASQSGVLAVARQLSTPTVAADVGGMAELATHTFAVGDAADLSRAIDATLGARRTPAPVRAEEDEAVAVHLRAYGMMA